MERAYVVKTKDEGGSIYKGVFESLMRGTARIGWSYLDNLDLRIIKDCIEKKQWDQLDQNQKDAWRCHGFLDWVNCGDYLVYPHQPEYGKITIVRVNGGYDYLPPSEALNEDFRSSRSCEIITKTPVDWYDTIVHPRLRKKLGLQGRFYTIYDTDLLKILIEQSDKAGAVEDWNPAKRVGHILGSIAPQVAVLLQREFPRHDLSRFCDELFSSMGYSSKLQEGPGEQGSDLVVVVGNELLPRTFTIGVQCFSWEGSASQTELKRKLKQLLDGWDRNQLDYGVLLTTASCDLECHKLISTHNSDHRDQQIKLIDGKELATLVTRYMAM